MKMKSLTLLTATAVTLGALAPQVRADPMDRRTILTVNESILIPGKVLPPGKYVMKLMDTMGNRNIVQIFNEDQSKLEAIILAFNNYRLQPTDKTELRYWETPTGSPPALRAWFYPGDTYGQEFAYPRDTAEMLARENRTTVPTYEATTAAITPEQAAKLEVRNIPPSEVSQAAAPVETPAPAPSAGRSEAPVATVPMTATPVNQPLESQNRTLLAQATPTPAAHQPQTLPAAGESSELPQTASVLPWLLSIGLLALFAAGAMTFRKA